MKKTDVKKLVTASMLAAMICVATMMHIPIPVSGYVNLGDAFVLLAGFILGPVYGALAAAIGSCITDLILFPSYAPATFVIKFLVAFCAAVIYKKNKSTIMCIVASIIGEVIMVLGYFAYEALFLGLGIGASGAIPFNVLQGVAGVIVAFVLMKVFTKTKLLSKL